MKRSCIFVWNQYWFSRTPLFFSGTFNSKGLCLFENLRLVETCGESVLGQREGRLGAHKKLVFTNYSFHVLLLFSIPSEKTLVSSRDA